LFGDHQTLAFFIEANKLKPCARAHYTEILSGYLKAYDNEVKETNIILVREVVDLMASIEKKVIDRGHMLLAGSSGSLRKTSVRVIAFKHKITLCTLSNIRNPTLKDFYKDLRNVIEQAAGQNKQVILFLEEHQLGKNEFYEKINSLISSGEVGGLFSADELEGFIQDPEQLKSEYYGKTLYESFIERTKKNLTIILSFDHRNK
jgi:dynein heavy chain 2